MGLDVDPKLAYSQVSALVAHAASMQPKNFVRVDMEGSAYTQRTLDLVHEVHSIPPNRGCVGAVIQSYMRRSEEDVAKLLAAGIRIRLCKGAYKEPAEIAFQTKSEVDTNYLRLMKTLLTSGVYHGLATHDEKIIREAKTFALANGISKDKFEFQMLYGIRRDLQQSLVREGWGMALLRFVLDTARRRLLCSAGFREASEASGRARAKAIRGGNPGWLASVAPVQGRAGLLRRNHSFA